MWSVPVCPVSPTRSVNLSSVNNVSRQAIYCSTPHPCLLLHLFHCFDMHSFYLSPLPCYYLPFRHLNIRYPIKLPQLHTSIRGNRHSFLYLFNPLRKYFSGASWQCTHEWPTSFSWREKFSCLGLAWSRRRIMYCSLGKFPVERLTATFVDLWGNLAGGLISFNTSGPQRLSDGDKDWHWRTAVR